MVAADRSETIISSASRSFPDVAELWRFRHLVLLFVQRNLKLRFKQTALGMVWVVLQPITAAGVFTLFFGALAKIPTNGVPYPVFVIVGLLLWQFFSRALANGTASVLGMSGVISKIYLPRLLIPVSSVATDVVDLVIVLAVVVPLLALGGYVPLRALVLMPLCALLAVAAVIGCTLWTSACEVLFRDTRIVVGFVLQFGLFFTPIVYPIDLVPDHWRWLYLLNPMVPIIDAFRWSMIAQAVPPPLWSFVLAVAAVIIILITGMVFFTRIEQRMMDRI